MFIFFTLPHNYMYLLYLASPVKDLYFLLSSLPSEYVYLLHCTYLAEMSTFLTLPTAYLAKMCSFFTVPT